MTAKKTSAAADTVLRRSTKGAPDARELIAGFAVYLPKGRTRTTKRPREGDVRASFARQDAHDTQT